MRSASTTASSVASKSTGPSSPFLALAGTSAARPFSAGLILGRAGARAPGRSRVKRSFSSAGLMLGTGYLRLAFQVVGGDLGLLDFATALLARERRAIRAEQRQATHWVDQLAVDLQPPLAEGWHREIFGLALPIPAHAVELLVVDLRLQGHDCMQERLRARRAAGDVDVDRQE